MSNSKLNCHRQDAKSAERSRFYLAVKRNGKLKKVNLRVLCDSAVNMIQDLNYLVLSVVAYSTYSTYSTNRVGN